MWHIRHRGRQWWPSARTHGRAEAFIAHFPFPIRAAANIVT
jgi:hypothetical protein